MKVTKQQVKIIEVASYIANKNNFYNFIYTFPCLLALPRPNTSIRFRLSNVSKPPLINLLSLLKPSTQASFLSNYPKSGGLRIHFLIILYFGAELDYESFFNAFMLIDNLTSVFYDLTIIGKKLQEDLALQHIIQL